MSDRDTIHPLLEDLVTALHGHLSACARRLGENDVEVQVAYETLRRTAQAYDDALFDAYDEVTPFEFTPARSDAEPAELAEGSRFGVLLRRDYIIDDAPALLRAGRVAYAEVWPEEAGHAVTEVADAGQAVYQLLHAHGVDGLAGQADEAGLLPIGGTLWLQGIAEEDETLEDEPFSVADEELVVYRVDEMYEDDEASDDDDEEIVATDLRRADAADR